MKKNILSQYSFYLKFEIKNSPLLDSKLSFVAFQNI